MSRKTPNTTTAAHVSGYVLCAAIGAAVALTIGLLAKQYEADMLGASAPAMLHGLEAVADAHK